MKFNDYQKIALSTDLYDGKQADPSSPAFITKILGLAGEAGEVAEKFKKIIRNQNGKITASDKQELTKELGDVLWYTSTIASYLGVTFEEVARANANKLADRKDRGVIASAGDNR